MTLPGRTSTGNDYRYGFQGQEKDDEIKGEGNSLNYKYRMHDPRVGRFFAVDPLAPEYPHNSPYAFSENRVFDGIELEGLEYLSVNDPNIESSTMQEGGNGEVMINGISYEHAGIVNYKGEDFYNLGTNLYCGENGICTSGSEQQKITSFFVTNDQLTSIFPKGSKEALTALGSVMNSNMVGLGIDTYQELAHFLSQAGHETGGFKSLNVTENLNYSYNNVCSLIAPTNPDVDLNPWPYVNNPEAVANLRYEGGYKYRGRGILQLTHLSNYKTFQNKYVSIYFPKINVVTNPELVQSNTELAVLSGLHYFNYRVMNKFGKAKAIDLSGTSTSTVDKVTKRVNGGYNGKKERRSVFAKAIKILFK